MANMHPDDDRDIVINATKNMQKISPKKTVLISTIDVYDKFGVDETYIPKTSAFGAYGENRLWLEKWTLENLQDVHIIRLPAIYGNGIKKNFVYDLINVAPVMLDEESYIKVNTWRDISSKYEKKKDGYFYLKEMTMAERNMFMDAPLNAFSYTDSRNQYQFYSLKHLWKEICFAIEHGIRILNIVTEPIGASELYKSIYGMPFLNKKADIPVKYDVRSCYCGFYHRTDGYFYSRDYVLNELTLFIRQEIQRLGML